MQIIQIITGITFGILISAAAWRLGSLSNSGAISAAITGSLIFGIGGFAWGALLLAFFISSSGLSKTFRKRKTGLNEKFSKGSQRDWGQVFANGGIGTLIVIISGVHPEESWPWFAFAGAMAAVNADTWATELGVLNPTHPRLITSRKIVEPGTSGGISFYGTIATLAGAAFIGMVGALFSPPNHIFPLLLAAVLGGVCGSLFDSFLGATVQAIYHCPNCKKDTERYPRHTCGTATTQIRGWSWLNNDLVNFLASLIGAVIGTGVWFFLS